MKKPKTVLQLIESCGPGGAETVVLELCKSLKRKGHIPIVGLLCDDWLNWQLVKQNIETVIINNNLSYDPFCLWKLVNIIKKKKVDVIHAHEFMMNVYGTLAGILMGVPVVTTVHGKNYYVNKLRRRFAYRLVARYSSMVAVSVDLRRFIADKIGISEHKIRVIHNGIDWEKFLNCGDLGSLRYELGIPSENRVVGMVGNLYPVKGYQFFLKAAAQILKVFPNVTFLIIGRGELQHELEQQAVYLGLKKQVKFLGFRQDVPNILQLMDVFVLSSLSEGLSLSIMEAMAAGKPVVATQVGGNSEIIREGKTGFLVPAQEVDILTTRILDLLRDQDAASAYGQAGHTLVKEKFSLESMFVQYGALYQKELFSDGG